MACDLNRGAPAEIIGWSAITLSACHFYSSKKIEASRNPELSWLELACILADPKPAPPFQFGSCFGMVGQPEP